jgi:hypothetical protein
MSRTSSKPANVDEQQDQSRDDELAAAIESYKHRLQMQYGEYGQWVAAVDIPAPDGGTALAFGVGHPVPVAHVERYGYESLGYVKRPDNFVEPGPVPPARQAAAVEQPADSEGSTDGDA